MFLQSDEILSTSEIDLALNSFPIYKGTYSSDKIPINNRKSPQAFIVNTARNNSPGEHWIGLICDESCCYYFDSFGNENLNIDILNKMKQYGFQRYQYNTRPIQSVFSENCGYFCIAFILSYISNVPYNVFLNKFSSDTLSNNEICYSLIKKYISQNYKLVNLFSVIHSSILLG